MIEHILFYSNVGLGHQNQPGNSGYPYQNQPNSGNVQQNISPNAPHNGNQYPNQYNNGKQYPNQPNYNPSNGNHNQGISPQPSGPFIKQNDHHPSAPVAPQPNANQRPDIGSNGVALAPFPDVNSNNNGRNMLNYDSSPNRPISSDTSDRYSGSGNVPLAGLAGGYTGAHVPLA